MKTSLDTVEPLGQPAFDSCLSEDQPLLEDSEERLHRRPTINTDDVEIDPIGTLKVCGRKKMTHDGIDFDSVGSRYQYQPSGVLVVRFIAQIGNHW